VGDGHEADEHNQLPVFHDWCDSSYNEVSSLKRERGRSHDFIPSNGRPTQLA
jgi:hypothetical protein